VISLRAGRRERSPSAPTVVSTVARRAPLPPVRDKRVVDQETENRWSAVMATAGCESMSTRTEFRWSARLDCWSCWVLVFPMRYSGARSDDVSRQDGEDARRRWRSDMTISCACWHRKVKAACGAYGAYGQNTVRESLDAAPQRGLTGRSRAPCLETPHVNTRAHPHGPRPCVEQGSANYRCRQIACLGQCAQICICVPAAHRAKRVNAIECGYFFVFSVFFLGALSCLPRILGGNWPQGGFYDSFDRNACRPLSSVA